MREHVVILKPRYLALVLAGTKTVECRASTSPRPPFLSVHQGDLLWLKESSGKVFGNCKAMWVKDFCITAPDQSNAFRARWQRYICADQAFWRTAPARPYWTLIGLGRVRTCRPFSVEKRDRRAWVVINPQEHWWPKPTARANRG